MTGGVRPGHEEERRRRAGPHLEPAAGRLPSIDDDRDGVSDGVPTPLEHLVGEPVVRVQRDVVPSEPCELFRCYELRPVGAALLVEPDTFALEHGLRIVAINYKDKPEAAAAWLAELGNPFAKIGADTSGRVAIDWGVYGVPESFILDKTGRIRFKQTGPIMDYDVTDKILPVLRRLKD